MDGMVELRNVDEFDVVNFAAHYGKNWDGWDSGNFDGDMLIRFANVVRLNNNFSFGACRLQR